MSKVNYIYESVEETEYMPGVLTVECGSIVHDGKEDFPCDSKTRITAATLTTLATNEEYRNYFFDGYMNLLLSCPYCKRQITIRYESWILPILTYIHHLSPKNDDKLFELFEQCYSSEQELNIESLLSEYDSIKEKELINTFYEETFRNEYFVSWSLGTSEGFSVFVFKNGSVNKTHAGKIPYKYNAFKGDQAKWKSFKTDEEKINYLYEIASSLYPNFNYDAYREVKSVNKKNFAISFEEFQKKSEEIVNFRSSPVPGYGPMMWNMKEKTTIPKKSMHKFIPRDFTENEMKDLVSSFNVKPINRVKINSIIRAKVKTFCETYPWCCNDMITKIFNDLVGKCKFSNLKTFKETFSQAVTSSNKYGKFEDTEARKIAMSYQPEVKKPNLLSDLVIKAIEEKEKEKEVEKEKEKEVETEKENPIESILKQLSEIKFEHTQDLFNVVNLRKHFENFPINESDEKKIDYWSGIIGEELYLDISENIPFLENINYSEGPFVGKLVGMILETFKQCLIDNMPNVLFNSLIRENKLIEAVNVIIDTYGTKELIDAFNAEEKKQL